MHGTIKGYRPQFPHAHYHSYSVESGRLTDINPVLRQRAEDIALICNLIGAKSVVDVGSNLGGFLFYLNQMGRRTDLLGIEGQPEFAQECKVVAGMLNSSAAFQISDVMRADVPQQFDAIILQNVYHYIFDKIGNHADIFKKFARLGKSIIWYNPMSADDPVIPAHANSNKALDWTAYNTRSIFDAALSAGFLHPIPLQMRFHGMGEAREHWLFILDRRTPLRSRTIRVSNVKGEKQKLRPHFDGIHSVWLDDDRSYKVFARDKGQMSSLLRSIDLGIFDGDLCDTTDIIVDDASKPVGYSQPRGIHYDDARTVLGTTQARGQFTTKAWRLVSRLIRHNAFHHDIGTHNAIFPPFRLAPILIDIEGAIFDQARQLSINLTDPNANEIKGVKDNLRNLFALDLPVGDVRPVELLRQGMRSPQFVSALDLRGILR
jgi:SAM-dependent methyltransferase